MKIRDIIRTWSMLIIITVIAEQPNSSKLQKPIKNRSKKFFERFLLFEITY